MPSSVTSGIAQRARVRRRRGSTINKRSQEYIAASTLKNEMTIENRNTTGTASPCMRWCLYVPSSRSWSVRRRPLVAYNEIEASRKLATETFAA